jgi:hypothetical protein
MTLPTRAWTPGGDDLSGTFEAWDTTTVSARDMVDAFAALLQPLFDSTVHFLRATVFTKADNTSPAIPRVALGFTDVAGTEGTPGWTEAVQFVWTFFDTDFNTVKLVLLDAASKNNFARRDPSSQSTAEGNFSDNFSSPAWAWASRAGFRPAELRSLSLGINDKLKKSYPGI